MSVQITVDLTSLEEKLKHPLDNLYLELTFDELSIIQIALTEWHRYVPGHYGDSYEPNRVELIAKINSLFTHLRKGG